MYDFMREYEKRQMRINASNGADCVGKLRKIENGDGNFDLYYNPQGGYCMSIAKPGSGCRSSVYGNLSYIKRQIRDGELDAHRITKYGRRLLKEVKMY